MAAALGALRASIAVVPKLETSKDYPDWRASVLETVESLTQAGQILGLTPRFADLISANAAIVAAAVAGITPEQSIALALLNASLSKGLKGDAKIAAGNDGKNILHCIRKLDTLKEWGTGTARQQEKKRDSLMALKFTPSTGVHMDSWAAGILRQCQALPNVLVTQAQQEDQAQRTLLNSIQLLPESATITALAADLNWRDTVEKVSSWWEIVKGRDANKQAPAESVFVAETIESAVPGPSTLAQQANTKRLEDELAKTRQDLQILEQVNLAVAKLSENNKSDDNGGKGAWKNNYRNRGGNGGGANLSKAQIKKITNEIIGHIPIHAGPYAAPQLQAGPMAPPALQAAPPAQQVAPPTTDQQALGAYQYPYAAAGIDPNQLPLGHGKKGGGKRQTICWICGRPGHRQDTCWYKQ